VVETMQRQHQANGALWFMFLVDDLIFKTSWPLDGGKPMQRLLVFAQPRNLRSNGGKP
jgi:hypothetical protein